MKVYNTVVAVYVSINIEAKNKKEAALMAMGARVVEGKNANEFHRVLESIEDITPPSTKARKGIGSY